MPKILLVEDNEMNRDMLSRRLLKRGFEVVIAVDGEQAVDLASSEAPDLILMDIQLPGMDGLEFLKKAQDINAQVKKILLTAYMTEAVISEAFRLGVHEFIEKPFSTEDVEEALARVLAKKSIGISSSNVNIRWINQN